MKTWTREQHMRRSAYLEKFGAWMFAWGMGSGFVIGWFVG